MNIKHGPKEPPMCPYCERVSRLVTGEVIYPHRRDLWSKFFYACSPCGAYVGCHRGTTAPMGRLANARLRSLKQAAHAAFDPLWQRADLSRRDAYRWLSKALGIPVNETHIGMFDEVQCQRVVDVCLAKPNGLSVEDLA